jgi:MinD-like ATPase involved in chromosome partitioning or flagellar assembly
MPDEPMLVLRGINEGVPFVQSAPNNPLSQEVSKLAASLMSNGAEEPEELVETASTKGLSRWIRPMARKKAS